MNGTVETATTDALSNSEHNTPSTPMTASDGNKTEMLAYDTNQHVELEEQFDEDGNVLSVGNLTFEEGTLGTGAYGTVRLARRALPSPPAQDVVVTHNTTAARQRRRLRAGGYSRSASAPSDSPFFCHPQQTPPTKRAAARLEKSASTMMGDFFGRRSNKTNDSLVAVKIFNKSLLKKMRTMERDKATNKVQVRTAFEKVEREIALMKKFSHPNLVKLFDVIDSPESDNLYMVLEYMPLGEILSYIDNGEFERNPPAPGQAQIPGVVRGHFTEAQAALFMVDILHALGYLHQHCICHRDLKPENILLDSTGIVKISDFGVSHYFEDSQTQVLQPEHHHPNKLTRLDTDSTLELQGMANTGLLTKTEGTWCFWSPEMCTSGESFSGYAADIWAAGVCLYIFVTGKLPFYSEIPTTLFQLIREDQVKYTGLSNSLIDLLQATLERNPNKRAGVGDCLKHPFLQVARNTRIRQLSIEFATSRRRSTVVGEEDTRKAFRIVTTMVNPAEFLKSAQKQIKEGLQAARERLSMGGSTFSSSSSLADEETAPTIGKWNSPSNNNNNKRVAFFQRGSLSSFGSSTSEGSSGGGGTSGKLFPIPQNRVMTESTRHTTTTDDSEELLVVTESKSDVSRDSFRSSPEVKRASGSVERTKQAEKKQRRTRQERGSDACIIQ